MKQRIPFDNLMLVAGTGQNSGKTSFICHVCRTWKHPIPLVCIKISTHSHLQDQSHNNSSTFEFKIYEEVYSDSDKDTSRMLRAGASKVLYIESAKEFVFMAFKKALKDIPLQAAIICESGSLFEYAEPSLFLMMHALGRNPKASSVLLLNNADKIFYLENDQLQIPEEPVIYSNFQWKLNCA